MPMMRAFVLLIGVFGGMAAHGRRELQDFANLAERQGSAAVNIGTTPAL